MCGKDIPISYLIVCLLLKNIGMIQKDLFSHIVDICRLHSSGA